MKISVSTFLVEIKDCRYAQQLARGPRLEQFVPAVHGNILVNVGIDDSCLYFTQEVADTHRAGHPAANRKRIDSVADAIGVARKLLGDIDSDHQVFLAC